MVRSDPQSYQEATYDPIWKSAMQEEFNSLHKNETWELVPLLPKRKLVQCKWFYRTNFFFDGLDIKYKARLVSKCVSQVQQVDYTETFAPVVKMDSIRLVLAIAASKRCQGSPHGCQKWIYSRWDIERDIYAVTWRFPRGSFPCMQVK